MKNFLKCVMILAAIGCLSFINSTAPLSGKWESGMMTKDGYLHFLLNFRKDGSVDFAINQKAFATGKYYFVGDTLLISDPLCNLKYYGKYTLEMYGNQDSVKFLAAADTCQGRTAAIDKWVYKRVKK